MGQINEIFQGLKVIELAAVLAGPSVGQFWAELGAQVIKVENLSTGGDVTRSWHSTAEDPTQPISAYYSAANWGKQSILLDLKQPEGQAIVHQLVQKAHVVLASYKPGDAAKLAMDYNTLQALNPAIIYGEITGYGAHDPRAGFDAVIQAESGFMSMNGQPQGPSLKLPVPLMDVLAAHHLKEGLLVALLKQQLSGQGSHVSISLVQAALSSLANQATNHLVAGQTPGKMGSGHPNIVPYGNTFTTQDGQEVLIAVGNDAQFKRLAAIVGQPQWAQNPLYATNAARVQNRQSMLDLLQQAIGQQQATVLLQACKDQKVPAAPVQTVPQALQSPQAQGISLQDATQQWPHQGLRQVAAQIAGFEASPHILPPMPPGSHTQQVLQEELGYSNEKIQLLRQNKVVY